MELDERRNGHGHPHSSDEFDNPYVEAAVGERPPELVEFALHTDPYANVLPHVNAPSQGDNGERRRNPFMVAISLFLILVLILPVTVEVFARLLH